MDTYKLVKLIIAASVFTLVFSVWCICVFLWVARYLRRLRIVQQRLGIGEAKQTQESKVLLLWSDSMRKERGLTAKHTFLERMELLCAMAGWKTPALAILARLFGIIIIGFMVAYFITGGTLVPVGVAVSIVFIFASYLQSCISRNAALFERQLTDALGIAARALRAGHPLVGTFQLISQEIGPPIGPIFGRICQEQTLGSDLKDSIRKVAETTYNAELKLFATAIAIQFQSGGNLAELMDRLATVIRARMRLNRRVRVITAQTQLSKKILIALPFLLFFVLNLINPQYMQLFYDTTPGNIMLAAGFGSILLGILLMNRIAVVRF